MSEVQTTLQQLVDPLTLWQGVMVLVLLLGAVLGALMLWRTKNAQKPKQSIREKQQKQEEEMEDALLPTLQPQAAATTTGVEMSQGERKVAPAGEDITPTLDQIIVCWKQGQNSAKSVSERTAVLRRGLSMLRQLPIEGTPSEVKNDWPFMFEGELRRLEGSA